MINKKSTLLNIRRIIYNKLKRSKKKLRKLKKKSFYIFNDIFILNILFYLKTPKYTIHYFQTESSLYYDSLFYSSYSVFAFSSIIFLYFYGFYYLISFKKLLAGFKKLGLYINSFIFFNNTINFTHYLPNYF
jgi:hypothetical protein